MLIAKGFRVRFVMKDGRKISPPPSYALLHDESGTHWNYSSSLVMPISTSNQDPDAQDSHARTYFSATPLEGSAELPPKSLSQWEPLGVIAEVLYTRRRPRNLPGANQDDYFHPIEKGTARLYKRGRIYRMELGSNALWNWRGIVRP